MNSIVNGDIMYPESQVFSKNLKYHFRIHFVGNAVRILNTVPKVFCGLTGIVG